jgi:hypothetical protein
MASWQTSPSAATSASSFPPHLRRKQPTQPSAAAVKEDSLVAGAEAENLARLLAGEALLNYPIGIAFDASGDLYIGDYGNNRVQEVAATTGTQWGQSKAANDVYTVAGSSTGTSGDGKLRAALVAHGYLDEDV